ncbi:MAG: SAM-dependent methyltransferase [bacterium]|nr:SAM-dependent methyltransferase [bacterium]
MKQKSIRNSVRDIRQEFRANGIYYTPSALAERLKSYVDREPTSVYDPTCGAGSLLSVFPESVKKYGQELDGEQLALISLPNFEGYSGDTLLEDKFGGVKFDCIVANPPFSVKWEPDRLTGDVRFKDCPALPPPSKADWAFMLHILHHLSDSGVAVVLESSGILYRGQGEGKVRRWFVENNYIDRIATVPENTFEDTPIRTCIIVLKKDRTTTDIVFEDGERTETVSFRKIQEKDFVLSPNLYLKTTEVQPDEKDLESICMGMVEDILSQLDAVRKLLKELRAANPELLSGDCEAKLSEGLKQYID